MSTSVLHTFQVNLNLLPCSPFGRRHEDEEWERGRVKRLSRDECQVDVQWTAETVGDEDIESQVSIRGTADQ